MKKRKDELFFSGSNFVSVLLILFFYLERELFIGKLFVLLFNKIVT